ncbi:MAG: dienelactone hydrolase family protein [Chloroflexi bacterium]|nr:dienelactone hydrolase family protein [Chloroflexota bacterium]
MPSQPPKPYEGMLAETVSYAGHRGETISGYLARPLGAGPYPGVAVIMEVYGLVPHIKELARKFAAKGYLAIAPDLYTREPTNDPAEAWAAVRGRGGLPDDQALGDLEGAAQVLLALPQCNGKIGIIGYCSGGRHVMLFACNSSSLAAAVDCYGGRVVTEELTPAQPVAVLDMVALLSCPVLGLFGADDQNPSPAHVARLEEELKKHRKDYEFHSYPSPVGHGFFADYRPSYRQEAAVDGWQRVFDFFERRLRS